MGDHSVILVRHAELVSASGLFVREQTLKQVQSDKIFFYEKTSLSSGIQKNSFWNKINSSFVSVIIFLCVALFFSSCLKNEACENQIKSLDSLSGAINQKLSELKQVDTIILKKAISKYENYGQFIRQNINDTVTKGEANHLQQFFASGKNLLNFSENRKAILARGSLINSQLSKLIIDAKAHTVEDEKLAQSFTLEKNNSEQLIKKIFEQQQMFNANLREFKLSLSGIEDMIKSRNNGEMPTIIKDEVEL